MPIRNLPRKWGGGVLVAIALLCSTLLSYLRCHILVLSSAICNTFIIGNVFQV